MKERFLNLNSTGGKILAVIGLLLIGIPGCGWLLKLAGTRLPALECIVSASLWAGAGLLVVFLLLVILEQALDARLFRIYRAASNRRIPLGDGRAECPNCGFRGVRDFEGACPGCGKELLLPGSASQSGREQSS